MSAERQDRAVRVKKARTVSGKNRDGRRGGRHPAFKIRVRGEKRAIRHSFSSGAKVQVEYTSRPPGATAPRRPQDLFLPGGAEPDIVLAPLFQRGGFLPEHPSPEQGASTSTASKKPGSPAHQEGASRLDTTALRTPHRSRFCSRACARARTYSFDQSSPSPAARRRSGWILRPARAQRSAPVPRPGGEQGHGRGGGGFLHITGPRHGEGVGSRRKSGSSR